MGSATMDVEDRRKLKKIMQMTELIYRDAGVLIASVFMQRIKGTIHCGRYDIPLLTLLEVSFLLDVGGQKQEQKKLEGTAWPGHQQPSMHFVGTFCGKLCCILVCSVTFILIS